MSCDLSVKKGVGTPRNAPVDSNFSYLHGHLDRSGAKVNDYSCKLIWKRKTHKPWINACFRRFVLFYTPEMTGNLRTAMYKSVYRVYALYLHSQIHLYENWKLSFYVFLVEFIILSLVSRSWTFSSKWQSLYQVKRSFLVQEVQCLSQPRPCEKTASFTATK